MYFYRIINDTHWVNRSSLDSISVSDLSTKDHDISVWCSSTTPGDIKELALAYALTQKCIKDVCFVFIPDDRLDKSQLEYKQEDNTTPFIGYEKRHFNIKVPTFFEQGFLAEIINKLIEEGKINYGYVCENEIKEMFFDLVKNDKLEIDLKEKKYQAWADELRRMEKSKNDYIIFDGHKHSLSYKK